MLRLHRMAHNALMAIVCPSVCLSVCLSVLYVTLSQELKGVGS